MRKNKMMRAASALLVAVLLTTSTISGTFAKYTTSSAANDVARVAKWGVELQVIGNLYGDSYDNEANGNKIVENTKSSVTVQSFGTSNTDNAINADDVVAPGTINAAGLRISLKGKPEVDGEILSVLKVQDVFLKEGTYGVMIPIDPTTVTADNFDEFTDTLYTKIGDDFEIATAASTNFYTLEDAVTLADDYYPVVYNLAGPTSASGTLDDVVTAIKDKLGLVEVTPAPADTSLEYSGRVTFDSNTLLETKYALNDLTLTWVWAFETGNDGADTILGMLESVTDGTVVKYDIDKYVPVKEYTDYCLDTKFDLAITVNQINE